MDAGVQVECGRNGCRLPSAAWCFDCRQPISFCVRCAKQHEHDVYGLGWTITCPDVNPQAVPFGAVNRLPGRVRSYPYHQEESVARGVAYIAEVGCRFDPEGSGPGPDLQDPVEWTIPPCPGGDHQRWPVMFLLAPDG